MTENQVLQQLQYLLRQRAWPGGSEIVFPPESVRITPEVPEDLSGMRPPWAFLVAGDGDEDEHDSTLVRSRMIVRLIVAQPGDQTYENAMVGSHRVSGTTSSKGRGLLEVATQLDAVMKDLNKIDGIRVYQVGKSRAVPRKVLGLPGAVEREYGFEGLVTTEAGYHGVSKLVASSSIAGRIDFTWTRAPVRFDTILGSGGHVIRYASGATAPTAYDGGAGGTTALGTATSAALTGLTPGTYSVSVFVAYDDFPETRPGVYNAATARSYSPAVYKTSITVA